MLFCAISLFLLANVHCEFMNNLRLAPVLVTRECAYNAVCLYRVLTVDTSQGYYIILSSTITTVLVIKEFSNCAFIGNR